MSESGVKSSSKRAIAAVDGRLRPRLSDAAPPRRRRTLRRRRHAAEGDADRRHRAVVGQRQMEGAERGRDVLVAALGDLVDGKKRALRRAPAHAPPRRIRPAAGPACHRRRRSPRAGSCAASAPLRSVSGRAERDQRRRRVADRRAVGDVAADRAHVAHLLAADAVEQRPERRDALRQEAEAPRCR